MKKQYIRHLPGFKYDELLHKYTFNGIEVKSVTQLIDFLKKGFDANIISKKMSKKAKEEGNDVGPEFYTELWGTKSDWAKYTGSACHALALSEFLQPGYIKPRHEYDRAIVQLMNRIKEKFEILAMEVKSVCVSYMIGYTYDILLKDKETGKIYFGDFKTNEAYTQEQFKELKKKNAALLKDELGSLGMREVVCDTAAIQLYMYKKLFEADGLGHIDGLLVFHISPELYGSKIPYKMYNLKWQPFAHIIDKLLNDNREQYVPKEEKVQGGIKIPRTFARL
jgi:hypothetical protein